MAQGITVSDRLKEALDLPNGARFFRCALQVNPFAYLKRHSKTGKFQNETDYNAAMINACREARIEVIGVTDHYRVQESTGLIKAAHEANIFAFGGFEAVTKDGVHFLCLFDPDKDVATLERLIGDCGIHNLTELSPSGDMDCLELLTPSRAFACTQMMRRNLTLSFLQ